MKIINPFNLIMYVVIAVVTVFYLRSKPTTGYSRVGWCSDEGHHAVAYDPRDGAIYVASTTKRGLGVMGRAMPDGKISSWFNTPKVFYGLLHKVVGDYLEYTYDVEADDESDS